MLFLKRFFKDEQLKKISIASMLFFLVLLTELFAIAQQASYIECIVKPLLGITLIITYLNQVSNKQLWYLITLLLSLATDILSLLDGEQYIGYMILTTAVMYSMYIVYFVKKIKKNVSKTRLLITLLLFVVCGGLLIVLMSNELQDLLIPVLINSFILMGLCSILFTIYLTSPSYKNSLFFIAFFFLVIANSFYGLQKFNVSHVILKMVLVMLYAISQYIICILLISENSKK